jgi:DNA-binding winged helix-turn-helix (wHTH) protein/tetratricopeptide (TPR) repeat protein
LDTPTKTTSAVPTHIAFDGWTLERATGDLWKGGMRRRLQQQPLQILDELLAAPGQLVTRERLIARLWPRGVVDFDTGLNTAMRKLRLGLGDDPNQPRYIETLPRKGYRFIAPFEAVQAPPTEAAAVASILPPAAVPAATTASMRPRGMAGRSRRLWTAAIASLGCAALLVAWVAGRSSASSSPSSVGSSAVSRDAPPSLAYDLYLAAKERQAEISPFEGPEPRRRVLELLDRALAIDPSFALAYLVRARTNLDFFISNSDVSDENLAAVRRDLQKARELSGNDLIGADVQSLYAALVDGDPERGLRLAAAVPNDSLVQQSKAMILMTVGRFRESDEIFDRFLALDPANQRLLRIEYSNLLAERRGAEALRLVDPLQKVSPPGRNPWLLATSASVDSAGPSFSALRDALRVPDPDGERLLQLSAEIGIMRTEGRYGEIRDLLDSVQAESIRVAPFTGALPGLGRMPVAALRGWNDLLRGDAVAAAANGRKVFDFVARQPATKWNPWYRRMLEAEAQVFSGNAASAVAAAEEALRVPSPQLVNRNLQAYREYLAAVTLAWAGEHDRSVELLERLSTVAPSVGPAVIVRDPLLSTPLQRNARYERLRTALEADMDAPTAD